MPLNRDEINYAVKCPVWQEFRKSLKNLSPDQKMRWLLEWVKAMDWQQARATDPMTQKIADHKRLNDPGTNTACCDANRRQVQVLNYLTALSRGGQIERINPNWQYKDVVEQFLRGKHYQIKR